MTEKKQKATKVKCKGNEFITKQANISGIYTSLEEAFHWSSFTGEHNTLSLPKLTRRNAKLNKFAFWKPHDYSIYYEGGCQKDFK